MGKGRYIFRVLGQPEPTLALAQSYWALQDRGVSIEASLVAACEAGFAMLEAGLSEERVTSLRSILKAFPLRLIAQGWASNTQDAVVFFERAADLGAVAMNLHLGHAFLTEDETFRLVDDVHALADRFQTPLLLETHRGRLTQDLFRTSALLQRRPNISLVLDVSHYLVAGEVFGGDEVRFRTALALLQQAAAFIHGRISNGQQVQVSVVNTAARDLTQDLWRHTMAAWLSEAPKDAVFVFEPELGPPPYAYLANGRETFSRDAETHALVALARDAWNAAKAGRPS